jgi:hypothetical protein
MYIHVPYIQKEEHNKNTASVNKFFAVLFL